MFFVDRLRYNDRVPWVNYGIIAACGSVFLLGNVLALRMQTVSPAEQIAFFRKWGFVGGDFRVVTLLTHMFIHGGWFHLASNMLFLWIFGANVERRLGPFLYFALYVGTGLCGTLLFHVYNPDPTMPLVGASGAISGVMGMYAVFFPRWKLDFIYGIPFTGWGGVVRIRAFLIMILFFAVDVLGHFQSAGQDGVAHLAHIGGFLSGAAIGIAIRKTVRGREFILITGDASDVFEQELTGRVPRTMTSTGRAYAVGRDARVTLLARANQVVSADALPLSGKFPPGQEQAIRREIRETGGRFVRNLELDVGRRLAAVLEQSTGVRYVLLPAERFFDLPPTETANDAAFDTTGMLVKVGDLPTVVMPYSTILSAVAGRSRRPDGDTVNIIAVFCKRPWRRYILNERILRFDLLRGSARNGTDGRNFPGLRTLAGQILMLRKIRIINRGVVCLSTGEDMGRLVFTGLGEFDVYCQWLLNLMTLNPPGRRTAGTMIQPLRQGSAKNHPPPTQRS